jgi:hypothetical protein
VRGRGERVVGGRCVMRYVFGKGKEDVEEVEKRNG